MFIALRDDYPSIAALHPVNGFLILAVGGLIARLSWLVRVEGAREAASAASAPAAAAGSAAPEAR